MARGRGRGRGRPAGRPSRTSTSAANEENAVVPMDHSVIQDENDLNDSEMVDSESKSTKGNETIASADEEADQSKINDETELTNEPKKRGRKRKADLTPAPTEQTTRQTPAAESATRGF